VGYLFEHSNVILILNFSGTFILHFQSQK